MKQAIEPIGRHLYLKRPIAAMIQRPLFGRLIGQFYGHKIPHRGCRIRVPKDGNPRLNVFLLTGMYESAEIRFIQEYLDASHDVIELGASIGGVSCIIARKLSSDRMLICVEANPNITAYLRENLTNNSPNAKFSIVEGAIEYDAPDLLFEVGSDHLSSRKAVEQSRNSLTVKAVTLSEIIAAHGITNYSLVCDIEGAEAALFEKEQQVFENCASLIIELHTVSYRGTRYDIQDLIDLIEEKTALPLTARYGNVCAFTSVCRS